MKLAFISDIHGNATALEAVLKDIEQRKVHQIYVLGDLCFRGPEPQRSVDLVRSLQTDVIKGNADEWVVRGVKEGEVPAAAYAMMKEEANWTFQNLHKDSIYYLENLRSELNVTVDKVKIHAFHATPTSLFHAIQPNEPDEVLTEKLMKTNSDLFIYAHIHKPYIRYINGKCVMNIGSVGLPFDGSKQASYGIVEIKGNNFMTSIVRVNYNVNKVIKQFQTFDYPNKDVMINMLLEASV